MTQIIEIPLDAIRPNPFRDFELYPINVDHVEALRRSIHDLGFLTGLAVRPAGDAIYELAAGHHRLEAAKAEGMATVEAVVGDYDDAQMVEIMVKENLTQRGNSTAAMLDSVAAQCRLIVPALLSHEGCPAHLSKLLERCGLNSPKALSTARGMALKHGGPGMPILYRSINGFDQADGEAKAEAGEVATKTAIAEALAALKASGVMAAIMAEARGEDADKEPPTYDIHCVSVFGVASHEASFRKAVTSPNGKQFIPLEQQRPLAKAIRDKMAADKAQHGGQEGTLSPSQYVQEVLREAMGLQAQQDGSDALLYPPPEEERVLNQWDKARKTLQDLERTIGAIAEAEKAWSSDKPFPVDVAALNRTVGVAARLEKYRKRLVGI